MCSDNAILHRSGHPAFYVLDGELPLGDTLFFRFHLYSLMPIGEAAKRLLAKKELNKKQNGLFAQAWKAWKYAIFRDKWQ